jgi:hypothetical protein
MLDPEFLDTLKAAVARHPEGRRVFLGRACLAMGTVKAANDEWELWVAVNAMDSMTCPIKSDN